ncbi:hypothetical protein [Streptomyces sp. NPDC050564]|uniref:hypothetical protein n=1 Tax=Streptomyces sp. NPDC050564 TaxID=3365631 RepID=UPI0037B9C775
MVIGELRPCTPPEFTEAEAAALSAAASITVERTLEPGELDALRRHFTDRETVEIIVTAGYRFFAPAAPAHSRHWGLPPPDPR